MSDRAIDEARAIVQALAGHVAGKQPLGSFSTSIYDTAWLSLVFTKTNSPKWLFPESFQYLLDSQLPSGEWAAYSSETDGLLNTMAAMLSLKKHLQRPELTDAALPEDLQQRIDKAHTHLCKALQNWDVASTMHVGFEILVPRLLSLLEVSGEEIDFPGRKLLLNLRDKKLAKFCPKILYSPVQTTLLHSLEAFIGLIDFDQVRHHLNSWGSMMLSPASTAAYLIYASEWDKTAEQYLQSVVANSRGLGTGAVPSAFPSGTFELSWTISSLFKCGLARDAFNSSHLEQLSSALSKQFELGKGLVGFDAGVLSDADDTAKTILSLSLLGQSPNPASMVSEFETPTHFRTYHNEQNSSISANCNVLQALLHCPKPEQYSAQVNKIATFLCDCFYKGQLRDKWNLSDYYSLMLLSQSFTQLLRTWDNSNTLAVSKDVVEQKIPVVLSQISLQLLQEQFVDGTWRYGDACRETTAYAVIALKQVSSLPWLGHLLERIRTAIKKGTAFLQNALPNWNQEERIWIEKVSYALPSLSRVYMVCAILQREDGEWGAKTASLATYPIAKISAMVKFFSKLPMFSKDEEWLLEADVALGYLFQNQLKEASSVVFPRNKNTTYKYLDYIPFTWISTNRRNGFPLSNVLLWDTMMIAVLDYQLDEYMETVCDKDPGMLGSLKDIIRGLFPQENLLVPNNAVNLKRSSAQNLDNSMAKRRKSIINNAGLLSSDEEVPCNAGNYAPYKAGAADDRGVALSASSQTLSRFILHIRSNDRVKQAPLDVQNELLLKLETCMLAHLSHEQDNRIYADQKKQADVANDDGCAVNEFHSKKYTYHSWLHLVSADNTHSPFTWVYFSCLAANPQEPLFYGALENYLASCASQHLANLCRQYNDAGSITRDQAEGNLNSLNFPEFHQASVNGRRALSSMKTDLIAIAQYERSMLETTTSRLFDLMRQRLATDYKIRAMQMFIDTVDLYGQLYIQKDITQRVK